MGSPSSFAVEPLRSARLDLEPLRVEHAAEAAVMLGDSRLHTYIGGSPATTDQLRRRYAQQVVGHSSDSDETWLNWMLRRRDIGELVGTVQATVHRESSATGHAGRLVAEVAWVVATAAQGQGHAAEAAAAMTAWLREQGVDRFVAHVHPRHEASMGVARSLGLSPTATVVDGEVRWVS